MAFLDDIANALRRATEAGDEAAGRALRALGAMPDRPRIPGRLTREMAMAYIGRALEFAYPDDLERRGQLWRAVQPQLLHFELVMVCHGCGAETARREGRLATEEDGVVARSIVGEDVDPDLPWVWTTEPVPIGHAGVPPHRVTAVARMGPVGFQGPPGVRVVPLPVEHAATLLRFCGDHIHSDAVERARIFLRLQGGAL